MMHDHSRVRVLAAGHTRAAPPSWSAPLHLCEALNSKVTTQARGRAAESAFRSGVDEPSDKCVCVWSFCIFEHDQGAAPRHPAAAISVSVGLEPDLKKLKIHGQRDDSTVYAIVRQGPQGVPLPAPNE